MSSLLTTLKRGFIRQCPACGQHTMFDGYLTVTKTPCPTCTLDFNTIRSDDVPAYFTILITGHIVLPTAAYADTVWNLDLMQHAILWLPMTIFLCLVLLPFIKGGVMAVTWWSKRPLKTKTD